jgi:hypothetical protein
MSVFYNMPNPFELFTSKRSPDSNVHRGNKHSSNSQENVQESPPTNVKEGFSGDNPNGTNNRVLFSGLLATGFIILTIVASIIYYFNSSFVLLERLLQPVREGAFYTPVNFNQYFGGALAGLYFGIFIILWLVVYCINILITYFSLGFGDFGTLCYVTTLYFFGIVGSTMAIINNVPSLIEVFENTVGYGILMLFPSTKETTKLFTNRLYEKLQDAGEIIPEISISNDFLLTTFNLLNFHEHFDEMKKTANESSATEAVKKAFYLKITDEEQNRRSLLDLVLKKYTIGHFTWILIASYASMLMTINTITM